MKIRDRIKELRRVRAGDLKPSPKNWRKHSDSQRTALQGVLSEIGYADALLARELPDGSLELCDGHLRQSLDLNQEVPVLILDLDESEAAKLLATLDPLAGMAEVDDEKLATLLAEIETENDGLCDMLAAMAKPQTEDEENRELGLMTREEIQAAEEQATEAEPVGATAKALSPPRCPIVPRYAEHYQAFVIVCENTIDEAWIRNRLNLEEKQMSHKGGTISRANVISCEQLREVLE